MGKSSDLIAAGEFLLGFSQYGKAPRHHEDFQDLDVVPTRDAAQGALACAPPKTFKTLEYEI